MNIKGKILEINPTQQINDTFRKREFVLEYAENPQYPEFVKFECIQDKCDLLDTFQSGSDVDVYFNLKGRKWVDPQGVTKYFNSLQAWKIDALSAEAGAAPSSESAAQDVPPISEDDLPF